MFNWDGCPVGLFDMYTEVGDVKDCQKQAEDLCCVELWVCSDFRNSPLRPECRNIVRRPVYGILKQIVKLSAGRKICLLIQCDEAEGWGNDTTNWASAIYPLLRELQKYQQFFCSVLFTRRSLAQIQENCATMRFRSDREKREYAALFETVDVLVTRQANLYADPAQRSIRFRDAALYEQVRPLLEA